MISSDAIRYAIDFCNRYPDHSLEAFLKNDINCVTEFITPFLLVQYKIVNDKRIILSMFFDHLLWDKKVSSWKPVSIWFEQCDNEHMCNMTKVPSLRKFLMRLS